jgi:hypothetical protein
MLQSPNALWQARLYRLYLQNVPIGSFLVNVAGSLAKTRRESLSDIAQDEVSNL